MFQFRLLWMNMFAQSNNSLPNKWRNSGDFGDVLHEIAWLSCTCVCFRSLLHNGLARQCIWNIQEAGLVGGNDRAGSASRMSAQIGPPKRGRRADPERVKSKPLSDPKRTQSFQKADSKRTQSQPWSALVLSWVRSVFYRHRKSKYDVI